MESNPNMLDAAKQRVKFKLSFEVVLVSLIILLPSVELFSYLFRGLIPSFALFFLWIVVYFLKGYNSRIKVMREYFSIFLLLMIIYLAIFIHYSLSSTGKAGLLQFLNLLHLGCIFTICVYYSSDYEKDVNLRHSVFVVVLAVLCVFSIISIPYIFNNDVLVIRNLSSGQLTSFQELDAKKHGLGTNGLYSSLSMIIVFALGTMKSFKLNKSSRNLLLLCLIPLSLSIFISTFFASVGLFVFALFYYFMINTKKNPFVLIFQASLLVAGSYLLFNFFLVDLELFKPILNKMERFNEVGGDDTGRTILASNSINTFLENPLWGIGVPDKGSFNLIGEHMPWADFLGQYGMIITALIYLVFLLLFKKIFLQPRKISNKLLNPANKTIFILFILGNFISPMIFYPLSYCLLFLCGLPILDRSKL
ncbi:hypothetical protein [Myroides sp. WP-1]|uniref:hypothetical protein n=1 Tax=Myroides sp. WP-1 TaxID=2759944 RepID=UPI0015FA090B|nr:hypothetical protein [Myroides sp. WP-1]MBB1140539.1 hypothetical protein [Myroides sp. WP-1]